MAKRIVSLTSLTPTAIADATNLTNAQYFAVIQPQLAIQTIRIVEIYEGGLAGTSAPTIMLGALDSAVAGTLVLGGCTDAPVDAGSSPLGTVVKVGNNTTTIPQRSSAFHLHNLSLNAFGGIVRLNWPLDQQAVIVGSTVVNASEYSISCFTGGTPGLIGFHCMYEPAVFDTSFLSQEESILYS